MGGPPVAGVGCTFDGVVELANGAEDGEIGVLTVAGAKRGMGEDGVGSLASGGGANPDGGRKAGDPCGSLRTPCKACIAPTYHAFMRENSMMIQP